MNLIASLYLRILFEVFRCSDKEMTFTGQRTVLPYTESIVIMRLRASLSYLQHENVSLGLSKRVEGVSARQPRTRIRTSGR